MNSDRISTKLSLAILFGMLGFAGNWFKVELFFNVDFLFGSFFVMLAVLRLGTYGVISGFMAGICTYLLWNHPWAIVVNTCEALFVASLYSKRKGNLVLYDTGYWAVIGMPMVYLFYHHFMGVQVQATLLIMLKQSLNGVLNALLAALSCSLLRCRKSPAKERIPYSQLIFVVMASLVLFPAMFILILEARSHLKEEKAALAAGVSYTLSIARSSIANWVKEHHQNVQTLSLIVGDPDTATFQEMQQRVEAVKAATPACYRMGVLNKDAITVAYSPLEEEGKSNLGVDVSDRPFLPLLKETKKPHVSNVVMGKLGNRAPIVLLLSPIVISGRYKGFCSGVLELSNISSILTNLAGKGGIQITLTDGSGKVISSTISDLGVMEKLSRPYASDGKIDAESIVHWVPDPKKGTSIMLRWMDSFFVQTAPVSSDYAWRVVVEAPFLPVVERISWLSVWGLGMLGALALITVVLSHFFSNGLVYSIVKLQEATRSFPTRLHDASPVAWPESNIEELSALSGNFRDMASALAVYLAEQKEAEKAIRDSEERYRSVVGAFDGLIYTVSSDYKIEFMNRQFIERTGYDGTGELCYKVVHDLDSKCRLCPMEKIIRGETVKREVRSPKDNRWYYVVDTPLNHPDGSVSKQAMILDITDRKIAEEKLRESEERYRCIVETANEGIWAMDARYLITFANQVVCDMLGYRVDELMGLPLSAFVFEDELAEHEARMISRSKGISERYECRLRRKDGEALWAIVSERALMAEDGGLAGAFAMLTDITERKKAEEEKEQLAEQLRQLEKMEAVGRLAGGVAHDFNNMLGVILGYSELLQSALPSGNPHQKALLEIEKAGNRSRDIIRQLLAFSTKQIISPRPVDLNSLIENMRTTLSRLIGEDIELSNHSAWDLPRIMIDPSQIDQILMNLAINARDAMPRGGRLMFETGAAYLDDFYCGKHPGVRSGPYVTLSVTDDGIGINEEILPHIFEPFFTTKEVGKGTGLGLATVYGIVKQNGGSLNVYSEPGLGTTFRIYFPVIPEEQDWEAEAGVEAVIPGTGAILLVEDDEMMREMATIMLTDMGYTVVSAGTPGEALRLCEKENSGIDLLITDVVMPEMSGKELADRILDIKPGTRVLFMSGYTSDVVVRRGVLEGGISFIQKPFSMSDLARKLSELIGNRQPVTEQ